MMDLITDQDILEKSTHLSEKDKEKIMEACEFAILKHKGEKRRSGNPYYTHAFAIGFYLAEFSVDKDTIIAGILHDILENTDTTFEEIEKIFGFRVAFFVDGVSNLSKVRYKENSLRIKSIQKLFIAMSKDINICLIKLMDRLHNMRTLEFLPQEKQKKIAFETKHLYAPIADRLNMGDLKAEFEDLTFKFLEPEKYKKIEKLMNRNKLKEDLKRYSKKIVKLLYKHRISKYTLFSRIKSNYSTCMKMEYKKVPFTELRDLLGFQIVVKDVDTSYKLLGVIHNKWSFVGEKFKDYIATPKPNGYSAIHTNVNIDKDTIIEFQILTNDMYRLAKYGPMAHYTYKDKRHGIIGIDLKWFQKLFQNDFAHSQRNINENIKWLNVIYQDYLKASKPANEFEDLIKNIVFVFTPKGDAVDLPIGSKVIDFAYKIHSDIGDCFEGAYINGQYKGMDYLLKSGDIVNIKCTKNRKNVNVKWLEYATSAETKEKIRKAVR